MRKYELLTSMGVQEGTPVLLSPVRGGPACWRGSGQGWRGSGQGWLPTQFIKSFKKSKKRVWDKVCLHLLPSVVDFVFICDFYLAFFFANSMLTFTRSAGRCGLGRGGRKAGGLWG